MGDRIKDKSVRRKANSINPGTNRDTSATFGSSTVRQVTTWVRVLNPKATK